METEGMWFTYKMETNMFGYCIQLGPEFDTLIRELGDGPPTLGPRVHTFATTRF